MRKITSIYILIIITIAPCNTTTAPCNTTVVLLIVINLFTPILFSVFERFHIFVQGKFLLTAAALGCQASFSVSV